MGRYTREVPAFALLALLKVAVAEGSRCCDGVLVLALAGVIALLTPGLVAGLTDAVEGTLRQLTGKLLGGRLRRDDDGEGGDDGERLHLEGVVKL